MSLFSKQYRIEPARAPGWDYAWSGWYFITICTYHSVELLGDIIDGRICYSRCGEIVADEWARTPMLRPTVSLDVWVVMPNHVHGIIVIDDAAESSSEREIAGNRFGPQRNNLGSIIRGFKAASTRRIRSEGIETFAWQSRCYDHVIRSQRALDKIRQYIIDNPLKWELEGSNLENLWM